MIDRSLGDSYAQAIYAIYDLKIKIFPLLFASFYSIFILAIVTVGIALITVFYSHKIAGPIFRIEKNLEAIGFGDLTLNTKFRGNDQLVTLADDINSMVRSLNHTVRSCSEALDRVERSEERVMELLRTNAGDEGLEIALKELRDSVFELKRAAETVRIRE